MPEQKRTFPLWIGFAALAVIVAGALWYYSFVATTPPGVSENPAATLLENNVAYAEAYELNSAGKFSEARAKYEQALLEADTPASEAQIKMKIAHTVRDDGDLVRAAQLYIEIANDSSYTSMARAYAVQALALLGDYTGDSAVRAETFKVEPFASLRVPNNFQLSYRNLFEYASSLYPLAIPELRSAMWYAQSLLRDERGGLDLRPETAAEYRAIVEASLARANADIARTKDDPNEAVLKPEIARSRAIVLGRMALAGYGSLEEAEQAYASALQEHLDRGVPRDGYMRYWYALYLVEVGNRTNDIVTLLAPLYTDPAYTSSNVVSFLTTERNNQLGAKVRLQALADIDPNFKDFLISLGWTASDFE